MLQLMTNSSYHFSIIWAKSIEFSTFTLYNIERDISNENFIFMHKIISKKWNYIILFHKNHFEINRGVINER